MGLGRPASYPSATWRNRTSSGTRISRRVAIRLRPRAQGAARFVVFANLAAVASGVLLVWAGAQSLGEGSLAASGVGDAAHHAFGVGVVTCLIVGMARLLAPFFSLRRAEPRGAWIIHIGVFGMLAVATIVRLVSGLLWGQVTVESRMCLAAAAGSLAWLGLVVFAVTVVQAVNSEERMKATLAAGAGMRGSPRVPRE